MNHWSPSFVGRFPLAQQALQFAADAHGGQRRAVDNAPFVLHPLEVASMLANRDQPDEVIAAALLHDAIENAAVSPDELERRFGAGVRRLVEALTEDPSIHDYAERKAALRRRVALSGPRTALIFAADKVAKVRELRAQTATDPMRFGPRSLDDTTRARVEHYAASLDMLEDVLPEHPLVIQLRFELEAYQCLSPVVETFVESAAR